jgi:hypothetical protein
MIEKVTDTTMKIFDRLSKVLAWIAIPAAVAWIILPAVLR